MFVNTYNMKKEELLKQIIDLELEVSELNHKLKKKCDDYAIKYGKWKVNDSVIVRWEDNKSIVCYGKISTVRFDGHGFTYMVRPTKKDGSPNNLHKSYKVIRYNSSIYYIESYE